MKHKKAACLIKDGCFWYYKSVDAVHPNNGVEYLRLFLYNEGVIGLTWLLLDYYIRHKNCQPSLVVNIRLSRLKPIWAFA